MKKFLLILTGIFLFINHLPLSAQVSLNTKLPVDPNVKVGKLPNGLTYYIRKNNKPEKKVELRLAVNVGSLQEDDDQQGIAHFTEHMAFNGTKHFKKNELVSFLQSLGIQFGADLNAYTGFDETVYILPVPLSDPENLKKGFLVLQDWASGVTFDNKEIDAERGVVLEESRLGKGADDRMFRKIYPIQYAGSRYAERLPIGKDSILKNAKYDVIKRFYQQYYRPDLQAVIAVGDIDIAETEKLIKEYFGGLKAPASPRLRYTGTLPLRLTNESVSVTDKEATNFIIEVNYSAYPDKAQTTIGDYRASIIKSLFTSMFNQRLREQVQSSKPPFLYAATSFSSYARGYEAFSAFAVPGKDGPDTALNVLMTEIARVKKYGFSEAEFDRAKKQVLASIEQLYNNRDKTESANYASEYIRAFLEKEPIPGIENEFTYYKELLPGIALAEVNALTEPLKNNDKFFVSLQGPSENNIQIPDKTTLLANAEKALQAPVKPYEEKAIATTLLKKIPQPGTIISETKNEQLGTTELALSNGAKVFLKPTDFKNDQILLTSFHKGGLSLYSAEDKFSATYAATIVQQTGAGEFSPTDLRKFLAGKNVSVIPRISSLSAGFSGSSSVKDLETLFQLIYLYSTDPRKDEALFNGWKDKQKGQMQFALADPQTAFIDTFYQVLYQKNPLAPVTLPRPEDFDKINPERSFEIYKEQLGDATDFNFILVGSFNIEKIKPLITTYLASLPATGKPASYVDNGVRRVKGDQSFNFKKGTEPKSFILTLYSGEVPYSEELAMKVNALTEILNIKIIEDLREKLGAIYGGGFGGGLSRVPYSSYTLALQLPCGPENVDKLIAAANAEIDSIKKYGPKKEDLDKVKKTWIEQYHVQVKENNYWSGKLQNILFEGADAQRIFEYEKNVNALTPEDIKATANLLFDGKNVLQAVLYPDNVTNKEDDKPKKSF